MSCRNPPRSHAAPSRSFGSVQFKLRRLVSRHEQVKFAFDQLNDQIRTGLLEAEDVIASLAIPLMNLVGLKTVEMAAESRFSTVITSVDRSDSQEENYMNRAMTACDELMERQKLQLMQLISLLKKIEVLVNSSQRNFFQNLANHQAFMKKFFLKAFTHVSAIHQSGQSNDLCPMMLKILKATFDQVGVALGSLEVGVDDLISELAEKMCNPMVQYVSGLRVEMKTGTCSRLLKVIKEMDGEMKVRNFELEEARRKTRLAEQSRIEALSKLKKSEEIAKKLTLSLGLLTGDAPESKENLTEKKSLSMKEDEAKDDNLLWDLLRKKRKCQAPDSPLGSKELLGIGTWNIRLNSTRAVSSFGHRPVTRSLLKKPDLLFNSRMLLSSSPSATTQNVLCGKCIIP